MTTTLQVALEESLARWPDGCLAVAYSGGLDSTTLLHAMAGLPAARQRGLRAIHIDHGLHPHSADWARHCAAYAGQLGVPIEILAVRVDPGSGQGREGAARAARYAAFLDSLGDGETLVTAQHQDDQAETVLLRLLRGAGAGALGAMPLRRKLGPGFLLRPWLSVSRERIAGYARENQLQWIDDPSNQDLGLDRNYLRHTVMPVLRQRWPHADQAICASAGLARRAGRALRDQARRTLAEIGDAAGTSIALNALRGLDPPLFGEVLREWLAANGLPAPSAALLDSARRELLIERRDANPQLRWHGKLLRRYRDRVYIAAQTSPGGEWSLHWDGTSALRLPADGGVLQLSPATAADFSVRSRRGGEVIRLSDQRPRQSVKHLLQERQVPPWERIRLPFLWHGNDLWAVGDELLAVEFLRWLAAHGSHFTFAR